MSHSTATTRPIHRIAELDGLRGISVLLVVLFHMSKFSGYVVLPQKVLSLFDDWGGSGVQIFFVISGFVITRLLIAERERTGHISLRGFYTRRFFRIMPAYWVYSFAVVILSFCGVLALKSEGVPQITGFLVSNLFLSDIIYPSWFWGHTWSLSVEEQFYIFFPLIFRTIWKSWRPALGMALFLAGVYVSFLFCGPIIGLIFRIAHRINPHLDWSRYLEPGRIFNYPYIAVGVFMAVYWDIVLVALQRLPGFLYLVLFLFVALESWVFGGGIPGSLFLDLRPFLVGAIVAWTVVHPEYFGFLRWRIVQLLGACSYSIYLWQQMFTGGADRYGPWYPRGLWVALPLLFICAGLSYFLIERNFIAMGRRLTADSSRDHPPSTVRLEMFSSP